MEEVPKPTKIYLGAEAFDMMKEALEFHQKHQWQPIETAPMDGTNLLVTDGKTTELGWHDEFDEPNDPWCGYIKRPTHWMPLPEPPKQ